MNRARRTAWPIPTDTATDRARTLATGLLRAISTATDLADLQAQARAYEDQAQGFGELWFRVVVPAPNGRWLTVAETAQYAGVSPSRVRAWTSTGTTTAGKLIRHPNGCYLDREVDTYLAALRTPTAARKEPA